MKQLLSSFIVVVGLIILVWKYDSEIKQNKKEIIREKINLKRIDENLQRETNNDIYWKGYIRGMRYYEKHPNIDIDSLERVKR